MVVSVIASFTRTEFTVSTVCKLTISKTVIPNDVGPNITALRGGNDGITAELLWLVRSPFSERIEGAASTTGRRKESDGGQPKAGSGTHARRLVNRQLRNQPQSASVALGTLLTQVMSKTILVCGYGPGISDAVARKFGAEGFAVALVARSADKLDAGVKALSALGIRAVAFPTDLSEPEAVTQLVRSVQQTLGPVTVIHWNAYAAGAGDLTTAHLDEVRKSFDVGVTGLLAAVQEALPDLKRQPDSAVLVTGGGLAFYDSKVDTMAVRWNVMGLAVAKAAQHKLVGLLGEKLAAEGVYVGEVVVLGMVKGTPFDTGNATLEASAVAEKFFELFTARKDRTVKIG